MDISEPPDIRHLLPSPPAHTARCPVCAAPELSGGVLQAETLEGLFAAVADHTVKVHGGGPTDAFETAERAVPTVGAAYREDAAARPWLYGAPDKGDPSGHI